MQPHQRLETLLNAHGSDQKNRGGRSPTLLADSGACTTGGKLELTSIPEAEWQIVENKALEFWEEIAAESDRRPRVVQILKNYRETMVKAGPPYRYG